MADVETLMAPKDLEVALERDEAAQRYFDVCPDAYKRNLLRRVKLAKADGTCLKPIDAIFTSCARRDRIPQI